MDKSNTVLGKSVCYLAGPIDHAKDLGVNYRRYVINESEKKGLGIKFLDPTNKLVGLADDVGVEQANIQRFKENNEWDKLTTMMRKIVRADLRQVDLSDFIIVLVDTNVHMCGTYHELILADIQKKPVLAVIVGGKDKAPSWLFGIIDHNLMFDDLDACIDYLSQINKGEVNLSDRWVLFRKELEK